MRAKTEKLKKAQGTLKKARGGEKKKAAKVIDFDTSDIKPAENILSGARPIFSELVKLLTNLGLLDEADKFTITNCANALYLLRQLSKQIEKLEEDGGNLFGWKEWSMYQMAEKNYMAYSQRLGLDPASRDKIKTFTAKKDEPEKPSSPLGLVGNL